MPHSVPEGEEEGEKGGEGIPHVHAAHMSCSVVVTARMYTLATFVHQGGSTTAQTHMYVLSALTRGGYSCLQ